VKADSELLDEMNKLCYTAYKLYKGKKIVFLLRRVQPYDELFKLRQ